MYENKLKSCIDKKLITSFIINIYHKNPSEKTRNDLLRTLSSLLEMTKEEEEKIGLQ